MKGSYKLGMYEKASPDDMTWENRFEAVKECGYDYIEISIDESDKRLARLEWNDKEIRDLASLARDCGIFLGSICLSGQRRFPLGLDNPRVLEVMKKALRFASLAGIPIIQLAGYDVYYEKSTPDTLRRFEVNLRKAAEMAAQEGVIIAFETMETSFMDTVGKAMKYVSLIDNPYLQVYPDVGNLNNAAILYGSDVVDDILSGKGHIVATHIKDTVPGTYRNLLLGQGIVDFPATVGAAYSLGVRRFVTEMWYLGNPEWKTDLKNAVSYARSVLDKLPD